MLAHGATGTRAPARVVRSIVAAALAVVGVAYTDGTAYAAVPAVSIAIPPPDGDSGWHRAQPSLVIEATDPDGIASLTFGFTSPGTADTYASPYPATVSASTQPTTPGTSTLTASATSGTADTATTTATVKWDPDAPVQPGPASFYDDTGLQSETTSSDSTICLRWGASSDVVSGLRDYRVQLAESPDFASVVAERYTSSTATNTCFAAADGVEPGHAYYGRVSARDQAGNESSWTAPSNRVAVTDQATGPALAHAPVTSAYFGQDIPISLIASCHTASTCAARLYYRPTPVAGIDAPLKAGWTRVDLTAGADTTVNGAMAREWHGVIPGAAVTTVGIDYWLEAEDNLALTQFPGSAYVGVAQANGVQPAAHSHLHVHTFTPPIVAHEPPPFARDGRNLTLSAQATCSTGDCTATLYYRTTGYEGGEPIFTAPPAWPRTAMTPSGPGQSVGEAGTIFNFEATIPGEQINTAHGVDYFFTVADGSVTSYWPGTGYAGYYAPTDGMRTGWHHLHVLETPHVAHAPVAAAAYGSAVAVDAQANCTSGACSGTLYYRTASPGDPAGNIGTFNTTPMAATVAVGADGIDIVELHGDIPAEAVDTRGVDYFFSVADGATTTWWPGTATSDAYGIAVAGVRVGYHHIRVLDPPHIVHVPVATAPALEDLAVDAGVTCATDDCSVTLHYADNPLAAEFTAVPMLPSSTANPTPAGDAATYRGVIPAGDVTTRGLAYYIEAFDGHTHAYSPGTSYWGAAVPTDGARVAAHPVRVLEPPHLVHAPVPTAYYGQPIAVEARSNCATGTCAATLHWRTSGHPWQSDTMVVDPPATGKLIGETWTYRAQIPAADATTEGVDYWIEVTDGYVGEQTPTHHITVLAPTAVLHAPVVTASPGRALTIDAVVPCSTPTCNVTLAYRATGTGALAEPPWAETAMSPVGIPTTVGDATAVGRYTAQIPDDAVTTRGVDYFIRASDGHTTAYSPGTAYNSTQLTRADGTRARYFHVHVAEPIRIVHTPVAVAPYAQPLSITATVNCATRNCTGVLSYRRTDGLHTVAGLNRFLAGTGFNDIAMMARVVQDLADGGTMVELTGVIPAEDVTTEGLDYYFAVTDGATTAHYPGTSYIAAAGSVDGVRAAWQHVEVPLRDPVRAIVHTPVPVTAFRAAVPVRFAAYCSAEQPCQATAWYRTTPNTGDTSQVLLGEPNWPTRPVRTLAAQPNGSGLVLYLFETEIPAEAVDTRGVDYVLKVSDGNFATYWPGVPQAETASAANIPLVAHHVSTVSAPAIAHTPTFSAGAGETVTLTWRFVCAADLVAQCRTAAYHRHLSTTTASGTVTIGGTTVEVGTPAPFNELITTTAVVAQQNGYFVLEATASFSAASTAGTYEQYFLWANDGNVNTYSPGTTYQGAGAPQDGANLGLLAPYTIYVRGAIQ